MTLLARNKNLDFLRGIAIILVMTGHFLPGYFSTHLGWSGVDLFFVLSGFFISGILFREYIEKGEINTGRFLLRRGLKIWPLFYTALLLQAIYALYRGHSLSVSQLLHEIFFIQNYFPGFLKVTWSLGVEEQFYLFTAAGMFFLLKSGRSVRIVLYVCFLIIIFCTSFRIINNNFNPGYDPYKKFYPLHLRADSLCAGIILSYYYHFHRKQLEIFIKKNRNLLLIACTFFLLPLFYYPYYDSFTYTIGFTLSYLGYVVLIALFLCPFRFGQTSRNHLFIFLLDKIAWVGLYSYAIYLFHLVIGFGVVSNFRKLTGTTGLLFPEFLIFFASNLFFGYLVSKMIEQPILKWRDNRFPRL